MSNHIRPIVMPGDEAASVYGTCSACQGPQDLKKVYPDGKNLMVCSNALCMDGCIMRHEHRETQNFFGKILPCKSCGHRMGEKPVYD